VIATLVAPVDAGRALLIRLYNPAAVEAVATIRSTASGVRLFAADSQGTAERPLTSPLRLPPYATRTVRLELKSIVMPAKTGAPDAATALGWQVGIQRGTLAGFRRSPE